MYCYRIKELCTKLVIETSLHVTLHMEQIYYCWAGKKEPLLPTKYFNVRHHNQLTEASALPPYLKVKLGNEGPFQSASKVSETLEFEAV